MVGVVVEPLGVLVWLLLLRVLGCGLGLMALRGHDAVAESDGHILSEGGCV